MLTLFEHFSVKKRAKVAKHYSSILVAFFPENLFNREHENKSNFSCKGKLCKLSRTFKMFNRQSKNLQEVTGRTSSPA